LLNLLKGDLGVAKLLDTSTAFAQSLVGTPYYLSPELCADLPYRDKSDVWAFGVILYEVRYHLLHIVRNCIYVFIEEENLMICWTQSCMLTHPFDARNQCALIMKIVQAQMSPIADHVPPELRNLIIWALQKDPKDRPKIKHILNDVSIQAFITLYSVVYTSIRPLINIFTPVEICPRKTR
jgi:NIMA (never in mitosis gene a)-related kinase